MPRNYWTCEQDLAVLYGKLTHGGGFDRHPDTERLAEAMGRTLNALQMRKRNFDALDCSVPGVGLWKAAGLTKRLWEAYRDNPEEVTAKAQAAYTRILSS